MCGTASSDKKLGLALLTSHCLEKFVFPILFEDWG